MHHPHLHVHIEIVSILGSFLKHKESGAMLILYGMKIGDTFSFKTGFNLITMRPRQPWEVFLQLKIFQLSLHLSFHVVNCEPIAILSEKTHFNFRCNLAIHEVATSI